MPAPPSSTPTFKPAQKSQKRHSIHRVINYQHGLQLGKTGTISDPSTPRESKHSRPGKLHIFKGPIDVDERLSSCISATFASTENDRFAPDRERPSKLLKTAPSTGAHLNLASFFPGPRFIVGTGENPHIVDKIAQDQANKLLFRDGADDSEPYFTDAYWKWFNLQHTHPQRHPIFDNELAAKLELFRTILEMLNATKYGIDCFTPKKKEKVCKWLTDLEEQRRTLDARPNFYVVRFDGYEYKVYDKYYKPEIEAIEAEIDEIMSYGGILPDSSFEEDSDYAVEVEEEELGDEGYESE